jgi:transcriptional regulator with XRE-family HTH domain
MSDWRRAGEALERRRKEIGISKALLARRAEVDQSTIYKAINGERRGPDTYEKLDGALGWPAGTLIGIAYGGEPPADLRTDMDRLRSVERDVADMREDLRSMRAALNKLLDQEPDGV